MLPTARRSSREHWRSAFVKLSALSRLRSNNLLCPGLPDGCSNFVCSHEDLDSVDSHARTVRSLLQRANLKDTLLQQGNRDFWLAAIASIFVGVLSVVPYNMVLKGDPGSPLFISFALHLAIIAKGLPNARSLILDRGIPWRYHAAIILCGCMFVTLKSDAYVRLPASLCMMLSNLRMLVGVAVQYALFKKKYSASQLAGVVAVTGGIAWASHAMQQAKTHGTATGGELLGADDFIIGVLEVFGSSVSLALLSTTVKIAFSTYGEHVEEQIFWQHVIGVFIVFPSQWDKVGPRIGEWIKEGEWWLWLNLAASVTSTFLARGAAAQMAGRSPNLLMTQLMQTLECFLQLLVVAFLRAPPMPPIGFWAGTAVLLFGTLHYLRASAAPAMPKESES